MKLQAKAMLVLSVLLLVGFVVADAYDKYITQMNDGTYWYFVLSGGMLVFAGGMLAGLLWALNGPDQEGFGPDLSEPVSGWSDDEGPIREFPGPVRRRVGGPQALRQPEPARSGLRPVNRVRSQPPQY